MKFLCVCECGNVRSVAMARLLHDKHGHEAIPIGWRRVSKETLQMFCDWADVVVVMQHKFIEKLPENARQKIRVVDVGPDRYGIRVHPDLDVLTKDACQQWKRAGLL